MAEAIKVKGRACNVMQDGCEHRREYMRALKVYAPPLVLKSYWEKMCSRKFGIWWKRKCFEKGFKVYVRLM